MANKEVMLEIARDNIERNLEIGDDVENTIDAIYEEAFTLAIDALHDAGYRGTEAGDIARELAMSYANP